MIVLALLILAAVLLSLSFFNFNFWLFAWCGFIPLFIALENKSFCRAFLTSFLWGVIFWSLTVYWLTHVTLLGAVILVLYLSIYFGLFGGIIYFSRLLPVYSCLFFLPSCWVLLEYTRSYLFTGFPWALIGLSQYKNLLLIQIADITGAWGVCFLVVLINTAFYLFLRKSAGIRIFLIPALALFLSLGYGFIKLSNPAGECASGEQFKISVIQGNISQDLKWDKGQTAFIQNRYAELTVAAALDKPGLIIWPEAAVPGLWGRDDAEFNQVFSLAGQRNTYLLTGAVSYLNQNYFNSALLINPLGLVVRTYSKLHLVPFGEYIPLKNIFPFLETIAPIGDIQPGKEYTIFKLRPALRGIAPARASAQSAQPADFGVLICFEDLFPELSREFVKKGARFLVNITNDAWYKEGSAPYQHFAASVFRAVENRVHLARCANTGISGFIDPAGRVSGVVQDLRGKDIFVSGYSTQSLCLASGQLTIYNHYGDFFIVFCLLLDIGVIISFLRKKKRNDKKNPIN